MCTSGVLIRGGLIACSAMLGYALVDAAAAHVGERLIPVSELTDENLAVIDLQDGRTDDWLAVIGEPSLYNFDFQVQGPHPPGDLQFRVWLAWHQSGRIYGAVETADDVFVNSISGPPIVWSLDDSFVAIGLDADHSGGPYWGWELGGFAWHNQTAQSYMIFGSPPDGVARISLHDPRIRTPRRFAQRPPYAEVGGAVFSEQPTITVTEFFVTGFDVLEAEGTSQVARLEPGKIIGIALQVDDQDVTYTSSGSPTGIGYKLPQSWCCTADMFTDALLVGPRRAGVEEGAATLSAWARIKARSGFSRPEERASH